MSREQPADARSIRSRVSLDSSDRSQSEASERSDIVPRDHRNNPDTKIPMFCSTFVEEPEPTDVNDNHAARHPQSASDQDLNALVDSQEREMSDSYRATFNLEAILDDKQAKYSLSTSKETVTDEIKQLALIDIEDEDLEGWVDEDFLDLISEAAQEAGESAD